MSRLILAFAFALSLLAPAAQSQAAGCAFQLGFATVHDLVPAQVGDCIDDEGHNPENGDGLQHTTNGLMVWRKADNWTAFTNGYWTWINGPDGLAKRLNTQRFSWEANPDGLPVVAADGIVVTAPPATNHVMTAPTCCVNSTSVELRPADISANLSYSMGQDGPQGDGKYHRLFRYTGSNSDSRLLTSNLPFTVDSVIHPAPTVADADGDLFVAWVRTRQYPVVAGKLYGGDSGGTYDSYNPSQRIGDRSVIIWIASTTPGLQGGVVRVVFRKFNYAMEVQANFQTAGSPVSTDAAVATAVGLATTLESHLETAVTAFQQPAASSTPPSPCCVDASKVLLTLADLPRGWAMTADQFSNGKLFRLLRGPDSPSEEIFLVFHPSPSTALSQSEMQASRAFIADRAPDVSSSPVCGSCGTVGDESIIFIYGSDGEARVEWRRANYVITLSGRSPEGTATMIAYARIMDARLAGLIAAGQN